jgi:mono/diheme cytochrome c family protein
MVLTRKILNVTLLVILLLATGGVGFLYSGWYDIAADTSHTRLIYRLLTVLREQSVAHHAKGIEVPPLEDAALVRSGAGNYDAMCTGCHLAPGVKESELSRGLYPAPPRLDNPERRCTAAQDFWIIKHGIKASGMPAWGKSMEDKYIWGMVAFLEKLPQLSPEQYRELVATSGGHQHGGGETVTPSAKKPAKAGSHHHHDHSKPHAH